MTELRVEGGLNGPLSGSLNGSLEHRGAFGTAARDQRGTKGAAVEAFVLKDGTWTWVAQHPMPTVDAIASGAWNPLPSDPAAMATRYPFGEELGPAMAALLNWNQAQPRGSREQMLSGAVLFSPYGPRAGRQLAKLLEVGAPVRPIIEALRLEKEEVSL